ARRDLQVAVAWIKRMKTRFVDLGCNPTFRARGYGCCERSRLENEDCEYQTDRSNNHGDTESATLAIERPRDVFSRAHSANRIGAAPLPLYRQNVHRKAPAPQ